MHLYKEELHQDDAWFDSLPDISREEDFFASSNSFSLLVAMEASSVFRCKTLE